MDVKHHVYYHHHHLVREHSGGGGGAPGWVDGAPTWSTVPVAGFVRRPRPQRAHLKMEPRVSSQHHLR